MMATTAPSAAPTHALPSWVDNHSIYFELSGANGPVVISFPRTSEGLSRAISVLFSRFQTEGHGEVYLRPPISTTPYTAPFSPSAPPNRDGVTPSQQQLAAALLRKLKP